MNAASTPDRVRAETAQQAPPRATRRLIWGFVLGIALCWCHDLGAQTQPAPSQAPPGTIAATVVPEPSGQTAVFTYFNRPIAVLRGQVLGRSPAERAAGAARILDDLVAQRMTRPVESQAFEGGVLISVGFRAVIGITRLDIEELAGETMDGVAVRTVTRLEQALDEAVEARTPGVLLRAAILAVTGIAVGLLILWGLARARRKTTQKLTAIAEKTLEKSGLADLDFFRASRLLDFQRGLVTTVTVVLQLFVLYSIVAFVFRRFPYTRPWGESLRGFLFATLANLGAGFVNAVPGLFTVAVIFVLARFLARLVRLWFDSVERGRIQVRWLYPETAVPTRRLATTLLWLFAIVVAYPYLPGSETDAFQGISVFLGLLITFGSSGLVNQVMSGFMLTYSRALRLGDFVRIGDVEGTVAHMGMLSTKVKTVWGEEVTIPNAVIVSQTTIDYSRLSETEGVFTPSSVTIGYEAPWRQVQSLLVLAAERTPGVRREPKPFVLQRALQDFYVNYTLYVCLERQELRYITLHALHANVQDLFNEYGVQIMSPNYVFDPNAPKVVAKKDWFAAPAGPDPKAGEP